MYCGLSIPPAVNMYCKQAQVEAYRGYVMALRDYWAARAELERAVGGRLSARTASAVMR